MIAPEELAVGQRDADVPASGPAVAQRVHDHGHLVPGLDGGALPALVHQVVGPVHLDRPGLDAAAGIGHIDLERGVRVGPVELGHDAGDLHHARAIEHGAGMMHPRRWRGAQHGTERSASMAASGHARKARSQELSRSFSFSYVPRRRHVDGAAAGAGRVAQHGAVGQRDGDEQAALGAVLERIQHQGHLRRRPSGSWTSSPGA